MMTLNEKKEMLEGILKGNFNIDKESQEQHDNKCDYDYISGKMKLITILLRKTGYLVLTPKGVNFEDILIYDEIIGRLISNSSWKLTTIDNGDSKFLDVYDKIFEMYQEFDDFCDDLEMYDKLNSSKKEEIKSILYSLGIEECVFENEQFLEMLSFILKNSEYYNESCEWHINIVQHPCLQELIDSGCVDKALLEIIEEPMLLYPYGLGSFFNEKAGATVFMTGIDADFGNTEMEASVTLLCTNWRFIFFLLYVDVCYKLYIGEKETVQDLYGFSYF